MRLLPFTLPLILLASTSLCAPTSNDDSAPSNDVPTTIEIIYETVTKTVVHTVPTTTTVTEPTVTDATVTDATVDKPCSCKDGVEGSGIAAEETVPVKDTVTETDEEITHRADSGASYPEPASDVATGPEVNNSPAISIETTVTEAPVVQTRTCNCDESKACRTESLSTMDACMEECGEHLEVYGKKMEQYRSCFSKNNASIVEAENCLFEDADKECKETKNVEDPTNWDSLSDIKYESKADAILEKNYLWNRDESKYNNLQTFFHCTKNCMHKKVKECTSTKQCTIQMPEHDQFAAKMVKCTKKNPKISQSIFAACQCLAWKNDVKELRGSCVVIGNSFYVDRA